MSISTVKLKIGPAAGAPFADVCWGCACIYVEEEMSERGRPVGGCALVCASLCEALW